MKSKKVLAVLLAVLMLLSSLTVAFSVFAADVAEAAAEQAAEEVTYTREELKDISDKYGYDLTEDQIDAIASGETTLSATIGDQEEDVTLIVQLPGAGALAGSDSSEADSEKVQKAQKKLESEQRSVQGRIAKKVMKDQDLDVMYSYSLLTNAFAINAKPSQINEIAAVRGVESVYTAPIYTPVPTDASSVTTDEQKAEKYFTGSDNTTANKGTGTVVAVIDTGLDSSYTYDSATASVKTTFHKAFQNPVSNPKLAAADISAKWKNTKAYQRVKNSAAVTQFGNSLYRNTKVPYAFAYSEDDIFVGHKYFSYADNPSYWSWAFSYFNDDGQGDHGTHVSGITAGYETDAEGKVVFEGVAPDAQLLVMKVFGKERAGNYADILAAMEDAVLLGADVINLSLGSWAGFTYGGDRPQYDAAFQAAADAGVVVCASAGNDYNAAKGNLYGTDESLASNPDNGIVGSPASYDDNLAVASISSKNYYAKSVIVDGRGIAYTNNATEEERSIEKHSGTVKDYALLKDAEGKLLTGTPGDFENYAKSSGIKGKYAVILRGETFTETVARAEDAGAIGLIVCDHSDGSLVNMMENNDVSIPAIFISKADGEFLVAQESNPEASHKLQITDATTFINNPTAGEMSDFSSWGVTPDLKLKPEITGYGGSVYSTLKGNKYGLMSGTSMSSPYLAGGSALVVQDLNGAYANAEKQKVAKALMMSTATPVLYKDSGIPYSPRKQGAGLVNIDAALSSNAYVSVEGSPTPKLDLGDDKAKTGVYEMTFSVVNTGAQDLVFDVSANVQTEKVDIQDVSYQTRRIDPEKADAFMATGLEFRENSYGHRVYAIDELKDVKFMSGEPYDLTAMSTVAPAANTVTVPAGASATVTVTVTLGDEAKAYMDENFVNGIYVEGFITLTSRTEGQPDLHVPYLAFYGDWTQAPMLDEGTWEDDFLGNPVHPQMSVSTGANVYWGSVVGNFLYPLGLPNSDGDKTPYDVYKEGATYIKDVRNVFGGRLSLEANMLGAELGLLRSAKSLKFTVTDTQTGEVYATANRDYVRKSVYYSDSVGMVNGGYFDSDLFKWDGKIDGTQNYIEPGTQVTYSVEVIPDYGTEETINNLRNTFSFNAYFDGETPHLDELKCYLDEDSGDVMLDIAASDDFFVGEVSYAICGYYPGEVENTTYLHTLFLPEHAGDTVRETLNLSEWARIGGLVQMRSVRITVNDFCQKDAVNANPVFSDSYNDEYWISFFDKVKVSSVTDILPVGAEGQLDVDYIYGRKLLSPDTPWFDAEGDANNSDYGLEEDFIYASSNPEVLKITSEGKLIPVSAGYADVTATGRYGKSSDSMRIRVVEDPTQIQVVNANAGDTVTVTEDVAASSLLIDKDIVIDLGGKTLHGVDGSPAIRVIGGNVTIKNGSVDAVYSENSKNAALVDILEDNVPAILVEGGNVTLDNMKIAGASIDVDGEKVLAGSAVVLKDDGNLTVKSCDLTGLYAINNSEASNNAVLVSGNFEGILGAVADMKKVSGGEGSEFIDITNTLADDTMSYLGTIEGGSVGYYLPTTGKYISAEQLANATLHGNSTVVYDAEKNCATLTFNSDGSTSNPDTTFFEIPDVNIENAKDYKFAAVISNNLPSGWTYAKSSFSSSTSYVNDYLSGEEYAPVRDAAGTISTYVKPLDPCANFTGNTPTLYYWPCAKSYGGSANQTMDIYGIALFNNKADAMSFSIGTAKAYTNNLKVTGAQSFNTQMVIDGTTLNVSTSFPDDSDGKYKWTANELALYTRVADEDNNFTDTFVEAKPITPDENGDVSVVFEGIDPSKAYVVKVNFALSLTAESKSNFFTVSEASAAGLVKAFPDLLNDMLGVDELEASVADLLNFFLYDMRQGFIERDARHYDCPLGPRYIANYPFYDEYPDIIGQNSNNNYTTWLSYWDNQTFNEFIGTDEVNWDDTVTRISYAVLFASILGDAKMAELMANIQSIYPAKTWNMLNEDMRVGNFGLVGSVPAYKAQLEGLRNAATGDTPREQLVNAVSYLANNFIDLYASVLSVINSTYTEGVTFKSYSDPTANDSLLNVMQGKAIYDHYSFGEYNDRRDVLIEKLDAVYAAVEYIQNAKAGLMKAMNAALYGTLASYQTEAADLMNLYFDENEIPGGVLALDRNALYEAQANYDGFITYELNGGENNESNPIGYQRLLPVTFADPTKEGYAFEGWYTTPDFQEGTKITGTTDTTEGDITVYAKWSIQSYVMTFMLGDTVVDTVTYTYGEQTAATDKLSVATGLSFKYWYGEDSSKAYEFGPMPAHDVTLKAQLSYMSLDDFTKNGDTYVWPKDDNASLRLTVDRNCTIDFGGKIVSNMNDLAIVVVEGGKTVTIKNAIFAPADYLNTSDENATVIVTEGSKLTLENCVIKGAMRSNANGTFAAGSAVKISDGTLTANNCVLTGLYAVDNTKGFMVTASPSVNYNTGVYAGQIATFASTTNLSMNGGRVIDTRAFIGDAAAADLYGNRVIVVAPTEFNVNSFDFEYLPDNDEVQLNPTTVSAPGLPDGSTYAYVPTAAGFDDTVNPLVDGSVTLGNFMVGTHKLQANYNLSVKLADDTAAFIYGIDDGVTAASKSEVSAFDALLPKYANIITKWNNNKDKIIQKFAQYADNALLKTYLDEIRAAIDNINGTGSREGILPRLEAKLEAYKALTTDTEKLAWLLANKTDVLALTRELDDNTNVIANNCIYLNAMALTFFGTDYTDKLVQVFEIRDLVDDLYIAASKLPSYAAAEYAAAADKDAYVASLLNGSSAYAGEVKVEGALDLGDVCTFTRYIDPTNESFSAPTMFTVLQNTMLKDIVIPEEFPRIEWKVPNTELKELGTFAVTAVYTPTDTVKYNVVEFTIDVEVISPATYCERNGHNYGDLIIVEADCTNAGNATRVCSMCGDVKVEEVYDKLGHIDEDNNNICDRCKKYINDTGRNGVNFLLGALNYITNFFRGILQLLTRSSAGTGTGTGTGAAGDGSSIFASDSFIVRFLRWLFRNI